ncbi:MAG: transposase domain-containing protein [Spirochaetota bacterium]
MVNGHSEAARQTLDSETRSYIEKLERAEGRWRRKYQTLEQRCEVLEERHRLLLFKRFARSSEQEPVGQQQLLAEAQEIAEVLEADEVEETTVTVAARERKKTGRKGTGIARCAGKPTHNPLGGTPSGVHGRAVLQSRLR